MLPNDSPPDNNSWFYFLRGIPRFSKTVSVFVVILYLIQLIFPKTLHTLALNADFILASPISFIQILTAGFLETSIVTLILNIIFFSLLGKYLEPIWGTREFLRFIVVVNLVSTFSTYFLVIFIYMLTFNENLYFHYLWHGFSGITAALSVAIKQLNPEYEIPYLPIRVKFLPSIFVVFVIILSVFGFFLPSLPFVIFGIYYGWFYLRFVQRKGEIIGDLNDTFAFSSFFPDAFAPIIDKLAGIIYSILGLFGAWRWLGVNSSSQTNLRASQNDSVDAERRRKRAARALEKKLEESKSFPSGETLPV